MEANRDFPGERAAPDPDPHVDRKKARSCSPPALVWPNGTDFDPATLHDWPDHEAGMVALARRWAATGHGEKAS